MTRHSISKYSTLAVEQNVNSTSSLSLLPPRKQEIGLVQASFSNGSAKAGAEFGPDAILSRGGLVRKLEGLGWIVHRSDNDNRKLNGDDGEKYTDNDKISLVSENLSSQGSDGGGVDNISRELEGEAKKESNNEDPSHRGTHNPRMVSKLNRNVADSVADHIKQGRVVLTLGGDHSCAVGSIAGSIVGCADTTYTTHTTVDVDDTAATKTTGQDADIDAGIGAGNVSIDDDDDDDDNKNSKNSKLVVIYIDAHADINTPQTSTSGNLHGMPLSFLTKIAKSDDILFPWLSPIPKLNPKNLIYIGLRDVDASEIEIINKNKIRAFWMTDIRKLGIEKVMDLVMRDVVAMGKCCGGVHLSFDVDALDPGFAPSTGLPVDGGLTVDEGVYIANRVRESGLLVCMDLVEVNPGVGNEEEVKRTVNSAVSVIMAALT